MERSSSPHRVLLISEIHLCDLYIFTVHKHIFTFLVPRYYIINILNINFSVYWKKMYQIYKKDFNLWDLFATLSFIDYYYNWLMNYNGSWYILLHWFYKKNFSSFPSRKEIILKFLKITSFKYLVVNISNLRQFWTSIMHEFHYPKTQYITVKPFHSSLRI